MHACAQEYSSFLSSTLLRALFFFPTSLASFKLVPFGLGLMAIFICSSLSFSNYLDYFRQRTIGYLLLANFLTLILVPRASKPLSWTIVCNVVKLVTRIEKELKDRNSRIITRLVRVTNI